MYRTRLEDLKKWKEKKGRLPLILMGARQVGKTWLLKEFGRECFEDVCYINFENPGDFESIFEGSIEPRRIIELLGAYAGKKIQPEKTLVIFDEVQEVPRALTALKYFAEEAPEYAVCCAGSLLGVTLHHGTSFPVGKADFLTLEPLSFYEFLLANGEETLVQWTKEHFAEPIPEPLRERYTDHLKRYFIIGGMPTAVDAWISTVDFNEVTERQRRLLFAYENDFSKHAPGAVVPRIRHVWESIPSQLAKENKKFVYGVAKEGARAREYEDAILWLRDSGLVRRVGRVKGGRMPLKAYEDLKAFKLYHLDIGLLRVMCEIDPAAMVSRDRLFSEYTGSLTEQFVLQELEYDRIAPSVYYWSEGATAEVDYIFAYGGRAIPVEAKAGLNLRAQSLRVFRDKYHPEVLIRTSLKDYRNDGGLLQVPLYMLWNLEAILDVAK